MQVVSHDSHAGDSTAVLKELSLRVLYATDVQGEFRLGGHLVHRSDSETIRNRSLDRGKEKPDATARAEGQDARSAGVRSTSTSTKVCDFIIVNTQNGHGAVRRTARPSMRRHRIAHSNV
jgi:hypothetical protein